MYRCKECDCLLWSYYSRERGICPECETPDVDDNADLEDKLEELL